MCPDRQIFSLYVDGELPSPWKEKLETHLADCQQCRTAVARYRNLGETLRDLPEDTVLRAQERVWKKLTAPELVTASESLYRQRTMKRVWRRSITLPLPAAAVAAAAVVIVVAFFALTGVRGGSQNLPSQQPIAAANMGAANTGAVNMSAANIGTPNIGAANIDAANIGFDDYTTVPVQNMNDVLKYLSSQENGDFMVVRLPESTRFSRTGEPTLINAADYSRTRRNLSR